MSGFFSGSLDPFWPHVALLTAAIIASFAVAAGIVLENPKWSLANVLVIGGVAIEAACTVLLFGFDEGVSSKQNSDIKEQQSIIRSQNDKIIALETRIAPRDLTDAEQQEIADKLKSFSGMQFDLAMHQDLEAMRLLDKIEHSLVLAGWTELPTVQDGPVFNRMGASKVAIRTVAGVWILWPMPAGEPFKSAAETLAASLEKHGIVAPLHPVVDSPLHQISIWVGAKP